MTPHTPVRAAKPHGLKHLKNNPTFSGCETYNRPFMKAVDEATQTAYFIRPDCKLWGCPACGLRRARLWRHLAAFGADALLLDGHELSFVTLTSHALIVTPAAGIFVWRRAWPKLSARWRRKSPGVQYLYVAEVSKMGRFHVHIVTTATLPTRWYKDNAPETGLGYIAKAKPIDSGLECGHYVTKYLTKAVKDGGWPKHWRRVNTSRKWPKPDEPETPYAWVNLGNDFMLVQFSMAAYTRAGWTIQSSL